LAIKAVLFDIDGTLVDSNDLHVLAWEEAFENAGYEFERQTIHDQIGKGSDMLVPFLLPESDEVSVKALGDRQGEIYQRKYLHDAKPFHGARDLLARARQSGQQVVLASSASQAEVDHYLELLDCRQLVVATTSADDVEHSKPAPDIFAMALKKVAPLSASEVMVVGDTPYDVEAASKCGIAAIAVRSGKFSDDTLRNAGASAIYDDVASLLADFDGSPLAPQG
jgi:HAD superfamily hydrolase (TIGR01509 family)